MVAGYSGDLLHTQKNSRAGRSWLEGLSCEEEIDVETPLLFFGGVGPAFAGPLLPVRAEAIKMCLVLREKGRRRGGVGLWSQAVAKWMGAVGDPAGQM